MSGFFYRYLRMKEVNEVVLIYAELESSESFENVDGTTGGGCGEHNRILRGVADSIAAATGLIYKDYLQTLLDAGLDQTEFSLLFKDYDTTEYFEVTLTGTSEGEDGSKNWTNIVRWYVEPAILNELIEEE